MLVVSYITHKNRETRNLELSLKKFDYDYIFVGVGEKWKGFIKGKITSLYNFLKEEKNHDYICVIDGYDVLACRDSSEFLKTFFSFSTDIVCGGEKFCFFYNSTPTEKYKNFSIKNHRKFANGGFIVGKKEEILRMYEWIINIGKKLRTNDDQKILGMYINNFPEKVSIDISCDLVYNTITRVDKNNFEWRKDKLLCKPYNTFPFFVHFPSNSSDRFSRYNNYGRKILGLIKSDRKR